MLVSAPGRFPCLLSWPEAKREQGMAPVQCRQPQPGVGFPVPAALKSQPRPGCGERSGGKCPRAARKSEKTSSERVLSPALIPKIDVFWEKRASHLPRLCLFFSSAGQKEPGQNHGFGLLQTRGDDVGQHRGHPHPHGSRALHR